MAHPQHTSTLASLEGAITVLFCLVDDTYALLNPRWHSHESLKKLSDSEVLTLALFQQLRGTERSCPSWWASPRRSSPIRRCSRSCTPGRLRSPRALRERRG